MNPSRFSKVFVSLAKSIGVDDLSVTRVGSKINCSKQ